MLLWDKALQKIENTTVKNIELLKRICRIFHMENIIKQKQNIKNVKLLLKLGHCPGYLVRKVYRWS